MSPPPCLCKVDCGAQQGTSPLAQNKAACFNLLSEKEEEEIQQVVFSEIPTAAAPTASAPARTAAAATATATATGTGPSSPRQESEGTSRHVWRRSRENRRHPCRSSGQAPPRTPTGRGGRILSERSATESGRLTAAIDNLRRRFTEHQVHLRETNRAIQELRNRGPHTPQGSPVRRQNTTPSPPGTRSPSVVRIQETPQRVVWRTTSERHLQKEPQAQQAEPAKEHQAGRRAAQPHQPTREGRTQWVPWSTEGRMQEQHWKQQRGWWPRPPLASRQKKQGRPHWTSRSRPCKRRVHPF